MIKTRHTTNDCVYNGNAYKETSMTEIFNIFENNKYAFFNGSQITFKPIGYVNNDYLQVIIDNDNDKRLLNQLNIINTKKIINDIEYEVAIGFKEIEIKSNIDINKHHKVIVNGYTTHYSIKELVLEMKFDLNTYLPYLKDHNKISCIGDDIIVDDTLQHQLLEIRYNHKAIFKLVHSYNILSCYKKRLDNLIYGGI